MRFAGSTVFAPLALAVPVVAASLLAYCRMYSTFPWYDDDGYLLITLRSFLDGHPLYNETYTNYGPFYYLWRFLIHGWIGVPVTHDATRGVALFEWGLCGLFAALLLRRCTGDSRYGVAGGLLVFLFLEPVTKEPSHPQLLAMVVTLGAAWAFTHPAARRSGTLVAGLLVGALFAIKPNLGVFAGLGLALVQARWMGGAFALTTVGIGAILLPVVLLRPGFTEPTVVTYAAICGLAALALMLDRNRPLGFAGEDWRGLTRQAGLLLLGAGAAAAAAAAFALSRGTTLASLLDGVFIRPMEFAAAVVGPKPFPMLMGVPALLAVLAAAWMGWFKRGRGLATQGGAALGIVVLGVASIGYLLTGCTPMGEGGQTRAFAGILLGLGTPWAFLLRPAGVGTEPQTSSPESVRTRETLIALAVTHMAIGFPSAGTQLSCGASLFVLAALAAAHDGLTHRIGRTVARRVVLALALVAAVVPAWVASATYRAFRSVGLPGAAWLRVHHDLALQL